MANYDKQQIITKISDLQSSARSLISLALKNPISAFIVIGLILVIIFSILSFTRSSAPKLHSTINEDLIVPFEKEEDALTGIKQSVDPRDVWTAKIEKKVEDTKSNMTQKMIDQQKISDEQLLRLSEELAMLRASFQAAQEKLAQEKIKNETSVPDSSNQSSNSQHSIKRPVKSVGFFKKDFVNKKRNIKDYLPAGSSVRGVLLTGISVGTGSTAASNPEPIELTLTDVGIFSKGLRTEQIKWAKLIASCHGVLSSERAKCRIHTLSLENEKGEIIEREVEGWITGSDGINGIRGKVVDKSSKLLKMAMLNGVLGGMSQFLQNQSANGIFPISPITGQQKALSSKAALTGGAANGAGDAFSKMADFLMERFNSMSPEILVPSGCEVDVLFRRGVNLNGEFEEDKEKYADSNFGANNNPPTANSSKVNPHAANVNLDNEGAKEFEDALTRMNQGSQNMEQNDGF